MSPGRDGELTGRTRYRTLVVRYIFETKMYIVLQVEEYYHGAQGGAYWRDATTADVTLKGTS